MAIIQAVTPGPPTPIGRTGAVHPHVQHPENAEHTFPLFDVDDRRPMAYDPPAFQIVAEHRFIPHIKSTPSSLKSSPRKEGLIRMRLGRRVARFLFWGLVLCFSSLAGGLWFAYWYITDSKTIARVLREHSVRYLPNTILEPGRIHPDFLRGELALHELKLKQPIDGALFETLRIPFLQLQVNPRKLAHGRFASGKIIVGQPTLRLKARNDGTWNLQGLLADPWPGPWIETPPIQIRHGTLELYPCDTPQEPVDQPPPATGGSAVVPGVNGSAGVARAVAEYSPAILRDVSLNIDPGSGPGRELKFEGSASGDGFERLTLTGTIDLKTGIIEASGELTGLVLSESLRRKLPPSLRRSVQAMALNGGVLDLEVSRLRYDPAAPPESCLRCNMVARLREGVWDCPLLPFSVNELSAVVSVEDQVITIKHARGSNGNTTLSAAGVIVLEGNKKGAVDLHVELDDLELDDDRLRRRTPADYADLWNLFKPQGRVNLAVHVTRPDSRAPYDWTARVRCRDVAAIYRHFPYPLDHLTGDLIFEKKTLSVDLNSLSGHPLQLTRNDLEPGSRRRRQARLEGAVSSDRRRDQERHASGRAQGRRWVQGRWIGERQRQGPPRADDRRERPS